jgi:hypothetical protein
LPEPKPKSSLSPLQQQLVLLMQELNFGRIEDLQVRAGEPVFNPPPRTVRKLKIGGENGPRPEMACADFWLKSQAIELLDAIAGIGDGKVLAIEVKHGLPFSVEIELEGTAGTSTRRGSNA